MSHQNELPKTGYVREFELVNKHGKRGILPFSAPTLWRMVKRGAFPAPVKISSRVTAWSVESVRAWMDERNSSPA